jgi:hypothetical protein
MLIKPNVIYLNWNLCGLMFLLSHHLLFLCSKTKKNSVLKNYQLNRMRKNIKIVKNNLNNINNF